VTSTVCHAELSTCSLVMALAEARDAFDPLIAAVRTLGSRATLVREQAWMGQGISVADQLSGGELTTRVDGLNTPHANQK
jgi:hypothetical protein